MKYWYIGAAVVALAVAAGTFVRRKKSVPNTEEIDGGVRHYVDTDAPKEIQSTEIVYFHCKFSTTDLCPEDSPVAGNIFTLHADTDGGYCRMRYPSEKEISFTPDKAFFRQLQEIVSRHDFAQHNGQHYTVSGLPPDIGIDLQIRYASGETICASNNQDCFLPLTAMEELVELFQHH